MITRRENLFEKNQPYHIFSRAVEKRKIFNDQENCYRFVFQMYAANIGKPAYNLHRRDVIKTSQTLLMGGEILPDFIINEHSPLVDFLSFALVGDHYHFNLIANSEGSIPIYMQRLNIGFVKYFNLKYNRRGTLFESRYKIIPIQTNFQLDAILRYINVINPLDIYQPGWREKGLRNQKEAFKFLKEYPFSSFPDLFNKRNSKILAGGKILERFLEKEIITSREEYLKFIKEFLEKKATLFTPLFLE